MKKFFTLRNVVLLGALILGLVAFFMSFAAEITVTMQGDRGAMKHVIWGCDKFVADGIVLDPPFKIGPAILPLVGAFLILGGIVGAALIGFLVKKPAAKYFVIAFAIIALAGAIISFFIIGPFARAYTVGDFESRHVVPSGTEFEKELALIKYRIEAGNPVYFVSILMGAFGVVSAGAAGVSQFLPEKDLLK